MAEDGAEQQKKATKPMTFASRWLIIYWMRRDRNSPFAVIILLQTWLPLRRPSTPSRHTHLLVNFHYQSRSLSPFSASLKPIVGMGARSSMASSLRQRTLARTPLVLSTLTTTRLSTLSLLARPSLTLSRCPRWSLSTTSTRTHSSLTTLFRLTSTGREGHAPRKSALSHA